MNEKNKENINNKESLENNDLNKTNDKKKNKIFLIALITSVLIFILYVFISQFIFFKNSNEVNSSLILSSYNNLDK